MLVTHATQTIKLTLQYEIQIGAKALSELKPISRGTWAVQTNAVSIPRVERLQPTAKPQLFLHITYGYIIKHYALRPGTKKKPELSRARRWKFVWVCVQLLVEAFPLSMRTLMTSCIRGMNQKNPHYTSSFEDPYPISEHFCEKTALLNSIFNIQPLYCGIINFSHLSKVWQFLLTPVKKLFKSCRKQIYNKKQKFSP